MLEVLEPLGKMMLRPDATAAPLSGSGISAASTAEGTPAEPAASDQDAGRRLPVELFTLRALGALLEVGLLLADVHDLQKRCRGTVP